MSNGDPEPDPKSLLNSPHEAGATDGETVSVELSADDLRTLRALDEAGVDFDLDGTGVHTQDPPHVEWTYEDFRRHLVVEQGLSTSSTGAPSTVEQTLTCVRYLSDPDEAPPVQLRPPREESWLDHVAYRKAEGAGGTTLNNYRVALQRLLKFLDIPLWDCLEERYPETDPEWSLPPDETVPRFWKEELHDDPYLTATFAHIFRFGFMTGVRPPSEIQALDVEDVDFQARRIVVTEVKKGGNRRAIDDVAPHVLTAPNSKSVKNYVEHWRPKVDTGESSALFLNKEGDRFGYHYLRNELSRLGKQVWPQFRPYTMRRWFATQFLIENDYNIYATAHRLGDHVGTVERRYVDKAKARGGELSDFGMPRLRGGSGD